LPFCVSSVVFVFCRSLSSVSQNPSPHRGNYAGICETFWYDFSGCAHLYFATLKKESCGLIVCGVRRSVHWPTSLSL
jgi:hypothetical protein